MKKRQLPTLMVGFMIGLLAISSAWASQVVTEKEKTWALQALAQESALKAAQKKSQSRPSKEEV